MRIHKRLLAECKDYDASYPLVQRYVKRLRDYRHKEGTLELVWQPGEAQVDFGEADFMDVGGQKRVVAFERADIHNSWTEQEIINLYKKVMNNIRTFQEAHPDLDHAIQTQLDYEDNHNNFKSFKGGRTRTSFPCPLLNEKTGKCSVYEKRPMVCRTHGTTHFELDDKLNKIESAVCEYIPSRLKNTENTPNTTVYQMKYEEIVNVTTNKGSLYIRKMPLFYGIHSLAYLQQFNPTKSTVVNRHNLDMSIKESNEMQLKKAASKR
ncbi:YkgJ family cysteine cluster protein [Cohnella sp. 56]|uniref:YkgJ family cysteine cluster protein n=1 Tax=Cohnella sp. 56 TaxID=3113722 RepID=UPI00404011BE